MARKATIALSLFLVVSLGLVGCGQKMTAEEILAKVQETVDSTIDAHAVVVASANVQGMELSVTAEVWEMMPNKLRAVILETSEPEMAGGIVVSDGENGWYYQPARNVVLVGPADEIETPLPQEMLGELQDVVQKVLEISDAELAGEEVVAGIDSYVLILTPKEDAEQEAFPVSGTATVWVDKDRWIILKATFEASSLGQGTVEVTSFELNPGLSDDLFQFEVPEGANVIDVEAQRPETMTLDEARAAADFDLLVPGYVSEGATLIEVFSALDSFILRYDHSALVSFTIVQGSPLPGPLPLGASSDVTVRGQEATAVVDEAGGNTFLSWSENDVTVTVAGHISLEEALKVAESLE